MSASTRVILDPKRQAEIVAPVFDFSSKCAPNDGISTVTVTVTVWSGVDPNPSALLTGTSTITGLTVKPGLTGGVIGVLYLIQVKAVTSLSGTLELDGILALIPNGM